MDTVFRGQIRELLRKFSSYSLECTVSSADEAGMFVALKCLLDRHMDMREMEEYGTCRDHFNLALYLTRALWPKGLSLCCVVLSPICVQLFSLFPENVFLLGFCINIELY